MKKLTLVILLAFMSVISATAQEADSLQIQHNEVIADSVTINKLNRLQRDFDFLNCHFTVTKLKNELSSFVQGIKISSLKAEINCHHGVFNYDLYKAYKEDYNVSVSLLESYKDNIASTKTLVSLIMLTSNFTEEETDLLTRTCDMFDRQIVSAENSLKVYELVIDMYIH